MKNTFLGPTADFVQFCINAIQLQRKLYLKKQNKTECNDLQILLTHILFITKLYQ